MTAFGTIFEVNISIGKLLDLLGHFDYKKVTFFIKQFCNVVLACNNYIIFAETVQQFSGREIMRYPYIFEV